MYFRGTMKLAELVLTLGLFGGIHAQFSADDGK